MSDVFNVTATWVYPTGQTAYNPGDTMKLVISGGDVQTTTTPGTTETVQATVTVQATDGATGTSQSVPIQIVHPGTTVATPESVKIVSVTDGSGRIYTPDVGGLFATAIA
jgi:hypothetical protein